MSRFICKGPWKYTALRIKEHKAFGTNLPETHNIPRHQQKVVDSLDSLCSMCWVNEKKVKMWRLFHAF